MAKYLIHAMPKRMWYVEQFLIPSMVAQGIDRDNISVYNDIDHLGNLKACMHAFRMVDDDLNGTWHLQDDVIISSDFKLKTEMFDDGIVCGFNSIYDGDNPCGRVPLSQMWFSFPCIRIPNRIARECSEWCLTYMINNPVYREYWEKGVNDDWMFRYFVKDYYKDEKIINLSPNIVDHIDYLIGGTVNSNSRKLTRIRSRCWRDEPLVEELRRKLNYAMDNDKGR